MSTLDVVAEILREVAPRALKARQIVELAGSRLPTTSRTPETVISRDLAVDVRDHGAASRFLRVRRGEFVLKEALPMAFYNDNDEHASAWTRNLIAAGEIAAGVVDERSIRDLKPADVACYRQFHAFSGIGVWSRALRDAGWPDDVNVWSGSCPCQGWSQAGKRRGFDDERHLWPEWFRLIRACRPALVIGEQVSSKDGLAWVDALRVDLEEAHYSFRVLDTPACSVGAPHRRSRLYFAAYARERGREILGAPWLHDRWQRRAGGSVGDHGTGIVCGCIGLTSELGDACRDGVGEHGRELPRHEGQHAERSPQGDHAPFSASTAHGTSDHDDGTHDGDAWALVQGAAGAADDGGNVPRSFQPGDRVRFSDDPTWGGAVRGFWSDDIEWVFCRPTPGNEDGCFRPVESGTQPLVDGPSTDVGRTRTKLLRCLGNAIVLPHATVFVAAVIDAFLDVLPLAVAPVQGEAAIDVRAADAAAITVDPTWTGPREGETAPSGMLYGRVPGDRWPYGPPSAHEASCNLFPHRGSPGGLFCDCAASAADDVAYGVGA